MNDLDVAKCVSVGDSEMDLSMHVEGSRFIGFNPSRDSSVVAFARAGIPVVVEKDLRAILPLLGFDDD
jgi:phosphoserine phosphatase